MRAKMEYARRARQRHRRRDMSGDKGAPYMAVDVSAKKMMPRMRAAAMLLVREPSCQAYHGARCGYARTNSARIARTVTAQGS